MRSLAMRTISRCTRNLFKKRKKERAIKAQKAKEPITAQVEQLKEGHISDITDYPSSTQRIYGGHRVDYGTVNFEAHKLLYAAYSLDEGTQEHDNPYSSSQKAEILKVAYECRKEAMKFIPDDHPYSKYVTAHIEAYENNLARDRSEALSVFDGRKEINESWTLEQDGVYEAKELFSAIVMTSGEKFEEEFAGKEFPFMRMWGYPSDGVKGLTGEACKELYILSAIDNYCEHYSVNGSRMEPFGNLVKEKWQNLITLVDDEHPFKKHIIKDSEHDFTIYRRCAQQKRHEDLRMIAAYYKRGKVQDGVSTPRSLGLVHDDSFFPKNAKDDLGNGDSRYGTHPQDRTHRSASVSRVQGANERFYALKASRKPIDQHVLFAKALEYAQKNDVVPKDISFVPVLTEEISRTHYLKDDKLTLN